jgi:hypothetical protein
MAVFVVNATVCNQDVVWSFCELQSSCAIALKLEWTVFWTPIQLNSSNPFILNIQSRVSMYANQKDP